MFFYNIIIEVYEIIFYIYVNLVFMDLGDMKFRFDVCIIIVSFLLF